jgi:alkanesulfonate monooxygenase SsuD/methylene tetrahydromethanopterin reductase-like flavin-dependent oxidoreductase (luciferase family)
LKVGVAFGWHTLTWEELLELVRLAEALGYDTAYLDGDISQLAKRRDTDVLDGWTVTMALLARTERIRIGSIRLVQHWHAARLAQVAATAERLHPGRLQFFVAIGDRPEDRAWNLPLLPARERIAWLDESLEAVRALWRGDTVTRSGDYVTLDGACVRPSPPGGALAIEIAAKGAALMAVVARHADIWNINWPAIPARVAQSTAALEAACRAQGRAPETIRRRLWIVTRPGLGERETLAAFRRWNPWFARIPDVELAGALPCGPPADCRARIGALANILALEMPVVDLAGLDATASRKALEALPAGEIR